MSLFVILALSSASSALIVNVTPNDNWCDTLNGLSPGDQIVLAAGEYASPCLVTVNGTEENTINVTGADNEGTKLTYQGPLHVIEVESSYITFERLVFPGSPSATSSAVYIRGGVAVNTNFSAFVVSLTYKHPFQLDVSYQSTTGIRIQNCTFGAERDFESVAVRAVEGVTRQIFVKECEFFRMKNSAIEIGCESGCESSAYFIDYCHFRGDGFTTSALLDDRYYVRAWPCTFGLIQDSTFHKCFEGCVKVAGCPMSTGCSCALEGKMTILTRNYMGGAAGLAPLVISGSFIEARNNILVSNATLCPTGACTANGAMLVEKEHLSLEFVSINFNTFVGDGSPLIAYNLEDLTSVNQITAVQHNVLVGTNASAYHVTLEAGNVECDSVAQCFLEPYFPRTPSPIDTTINCMGGLVGHPFADFTAACRVCPATSGAIDSHSAVLDFSEVGYVRAPKNHYCNAPSAAPTQSPTSSTTTTNTTTSTTSSRANVTSTASKAVTSTSARSTDAGSVAEPSGGSTSTLLILIGASVVLLLILTATICFLLSRRRRRQSPSNPMRASRDRHSGSRRSSRVRSAVHRSSVHSPLPPGPPRPQFPYSSVSHVTTSDDARYTTTSSQNEYGELSLTTPSSEHYTTLASSQRLYANSATAFTGELDRHHYQSIPGPTTIY